MSPMLVTSRTRGVSPSQPTGSPPELLSEPVGPVASVAPVASVGVDPVVDAEPLVPASPELELSTNCESLHCHPSKNTQFAGSHAGSHCSAFSAGQPAASAATASRAKHGPGRTPRTRAGIITPHA